MIKQNKTRTILFSPLNWGLGHGTRLIPIIRYFINRGDTCIIAGDEPTISILRTAFPKLKYLPLKGFKPSVNGSRFQPLLFALQIPTFLYWTICEHIQLKQIIKHNAIQLIISDNRYGLFHTKVKSVLITHQTNPYLGKTLNFLRTTLAFLLSRMINRFDMCWIPDDPSINLSGSLSNKRFIKIPIKHIGLLSRFSKTTPVDEPHLSESLPDVVVILSGPEPQRTILERSLIAILSNSKLETVFFGAQPHLTDLENTSSLSNIRIIKHGSDAQFKSYLESAQLVICRSGYSTLMDLVSLNKKALLIPTPGQYEQAYLAKRMEQRFGFKHIKQRDLTLLEIDKSLIT